MKRVSYSGAMEHPRSGDGRYRRISVLGEGGSGRVWLVEDRLRPGSRLALKETDPDPTLYGETLTDIASAEAEDEGGEEIVAVATEVLPVHTPDTAVDVQKIPNQNVVVPGESVAYVLTVRNVGRTDLEQTVLTEDLDVLVERGDISRYEPGGRQVILYLEDFASDDLLEFTYRLRAKYPLVAKIPQSQAYDYYTPEIQGMQRPQAITVRQ